MRVLIIHNQLWAHYKSKLFSEIYNNLRANHPKADFKVVHIALHEASRAVMKDDESIRYEYPYEVLYQTSLDSVGFADRLKGLMKAYHAYKPTVLNITGYFDWAQILLMLYAKAQGVKIVLSSESSSMDRPRSGIKERLKALIVNSADAYFCFGSSSAEYLKTLGVPDSRIAVRQAAVIDEQVILNAYQRGTELRPMLPNLPRYHFVYVGRLAPEKNLLLLTKAFKEVKNTVAGAVDWGLMFIGDGTEKNNLAEYVNQNEVSGVTFTGGFPWHKVPEWLAQSTVLVLPSLSEPWGLVVNEAMVCGMPVIVSQKCGCADDLVKQGVNGHQFDPTNQAELEEIMSYYIKNPDKLKPMGEQSRAIIAPFSSTKIAREMVNTYRSLSETK
ncbi:glycosyltransferase family 4 protein [Telluribacter sp. SYSU D00476]|uniref:glycosyltransferase family 4 protein n=1 Tax=Telluribacter sp. SYSU D00476 TaxID=2811430 RepID=UPI001FF2B572|nr:glycosyltransferase family 4 protein [Telluribacter sp. SYSU D00476]